MERVIGLVRIGLGVDVNFLGFADVKVDEPLGLELGQGGCPGPAFSVALGGQ